ncbi:hypothetical protein B9Z51_08790 [Limnohabitans sp. T6-5]|nr:hypothetical protein B9Z51_08790 [Limnohabitans sp. T6-5]
MVNVSVTADGHIRTTALAIDRSHAPAILQELESLTLRLRTFISSGGRPPSQALRLVSSK